MIHSDEIKGTNNNRREWKKIGIFDRTQTTNGSSRKTN